MINDIMNDLAMSPSLTVIASWNGSLLAVAQGKSGLLHLPPTSKAKEVYHVTNALYDMSVVGAPYWLALRTVYPHCPPRNFPDRKLQ